MAYCTIDGYRIDMDIMEVLVEYPWDKADWSKPGKLIAASPFREEYHPSFFVDLTTGGWHDSGAIDDHYESGNLAKLLAFLRNETYEESLEYLVDTYGVREKKPGERIELPTLTLRKERRRVELPEEILKPYLFRNPYLGKRGISEKVQRFMGVGYSKNEMAVTLPWRHADGVLANIKFRQIVGKTFWYAKGAAPIRDLVYGIDKVYRKDWRSVVVCEAEIDALSWMTCGVPAIALGGTAVTRTKLDLIRRSPIEELILSMDNDGPGEYMGRKLRESLRGYLTVKDVKIPAGYKDANDALVAGIDLSGLIT